MYRKPLTKKRKSNGIGLIYYYRLLELLAFATDKRGYFTNADCKAHLESVGIFTVSRSIQRMTKKLTDMGILAHKTQQNGGSGATQYICIKDFDYRNKTLSTGNGKSIYNLCLVMRVFEYDTITSVKLVTIYQDLEQFITKRTAQRYLKGLYNLKILTRKRIKNHYHYSMSESFYKRIEHIINNGIYPK